MLKKWQFAFILNILWAAVAWPAAAQEFAPNLQFIEAALNRCFSPWLEIPQLSTETTVELVVKDRAGDTEAAQFVRDVFLTAATSRGRKIRVASDSSEPRRAPLAMRIEIESWRLSAEKNRHNKAKGRYVQKFSASLRMVLTDSSGTVLATRRDRAEGRRPFSDAAELALAEEHQPAFATTRWREAESGKHWLQTLTITAASGITIFLLYHIRSR